MLTRRPCLLLWVLLLLGIVACGSAGGAPEGDPTPTSEEESTPEGSGEEGEEEAPPASPSCAEIGTIETGKTPLCELHVATGGDDDLGDGTASAPFATLGRALAEVAPGTAVRLHAGTYAGGLWITDVAGTDAAPVWVGGMPGEAKPVIQGGTEGLHLSRVRWLVLHDLVVEGATHNGINCDDGGVYDDPRITEHLCFRDLEIRDIGTGGNHDGLKLSGLDHYTVVDCTFLRVSAGSGIDHVGCHHGRIARCRFESMGSNAIQCKGGTEDLEILRCEFRDAGQRAVNIGGSTGFEYFRPPLSATEPNAEARGVRVIANVFGNAVTPFAFVGAVDCLVAHNTFRGDAYRWLFRVLQETTSTAEYEFLPTQSCRVIGNVFHFSDGALSTHVNIGPNTRGDTYEITHNLWYAFDDPTRSEPTNLPAPETGGIHGGDPFPDAAAAPRITSASPAAGAGTPLAEVVGDHDGRCYGDPPSRGAFALP